jgi:hypothetical protein
MSIIATIEGHDITLNDDGSITYTAKAAIDDDGTGPAHGDPCEQSDTSLHLNGEPLNADVDRYIVVPPAIIEGVQGIVLGCRAVVSYNGATTEAVVGDVGPRSKLGEISIATAKALGIPWSPISGGVDSGVSYTLWPGIPAPGYNLQAA